MCYGMPRFQFNASLRGPRPSTDLDDYCYYVAGVVGDMLTELFCDYSPHIARHRAALPRLPRLVRAGAADDEYSQGRVGGPQPRRLLAAAGGVHPLWGSISRACSREPFDPRFGAGMRELVGVAHAHLRNALDYTLLHSRQGDRNTPLLPCGRSGSRCSRCARSNAIRASRRAPK